MLSEPKLVIAESKLVVSSFIGDKCSLFWCLVSCIKCNDRLDIGCNLADHTNCNNCDEGQREWGKCSTGSTVTL